MSRLDIITRPNSNSLLSLLTDHHRIWKSPRAHEEKRCLCVTISSISLNLFQYIENPGLQFLIRAVRCRLHIHTVIVLSLTNNDIFDVMLYNINSAWSDQSMSVSHPRGKHPQALNHGQTRRTHFQVPHMRRLIARTP